MKRNLPAVFSCFAAFVSPSAYSQELPQFDVDDFQVTTFIGRSEAIVRSNDRDFVCMIRGAPDGYVSLDGCKPFVTVAEGLRYSQRLAEIAAKAEADRAEAERLAKLEKAEAKRVADAAATAVRVAASKKLVEQDSEAIEGVIATLRENNCMLELKSVSYIHDPMLEQIWKHVSPSDKLTSAEVESFRGRAARAIAGLRGLELIAVTYTKEGSGSFLVRLENCG